MPIRILKNVRPVVLYLAAGLFVLAILSVWMFPVFVEYYIEKNDVEWFGRELEIEDLDINLFTGKLSLENGILYEKESTEEFIAVRQIETNVRLWSLVRSVFELEYLHISAPNVHIKQNGEEFNFDDFLGQGEEDSSETTSDTTKYFIHDIRISDGKFSYEDFSLPALIELENIIIDVPLVDYRVPEITYEAEITQRQGGLLGVDGLINWQKEENFNKFTIDEWVLNPYQNYLRSYLNISHFDAVISARFHFGGNYSESGYVATSGSASMNNFRLVDDRGDSLLMFRQAVLTVDTVNTSANIYNIQSVTLDDPAVIFKYFESTDNFTSLYLDTLAEEALDTVMVSEREIVFENPFQYVSDYLRYFINEDVLNSFQLDSAVMHGGYVDFQDYSNLEEAVIVLSDMNARIDGVSAQDSTLKLSLTSLLNRTGELNGELELDRKTLADYSVDIDIQNFYISAFDPYSKHFTAHPLWEGNMNLTSKTTIWDRKLTSDNKLLILQPEVGKKLDMETEYNIPLRFAFGLLKDVEGNVELELPIEGDLDDPEYRFGKVILKVLMNILSKAVASPYNLLARAFDADEEDLKSVRFDPGQDSLANAQIKSLNLLVRVLENKEDLKATLEYAMNAEREKDAIALENVKTRFITSLPDSLRSNYSLAESVDNKDSLFVNYLQGETGAVGTETIPAMCRQIVGEDELDQQIQVLKETQNALVRGYLFEEKNLGEDRLNIVESEDTEKISSVLRPTFFILYDAMEYQAADSISGPAPNPALQISPVSGQPDE